MAIVWSFTFEDNQDTTALAAAGWTVDSGSFALSTNNTTDPHAGTYHAAIGRNRELTTPSSVFDLAKGKFIARIALRSGDKWRSSLVENLIQIQDGSTVMIAVIPAGTTNSEELKVYARGASGMELIGTTSGTLTAGTYHLVEIEWDADSKPIEVTVSIDSTAEVTGTASGGSGYSCDRVFMAGPVSGGDYVFFDNLRVDDLVAARKRRRFHPLSRPFFRATLFGGTGLGGTGIELESPDE